MSATAENRPTKIQVRDLKKHFTISKTAKVHAVDGVSFDIYEGEMLGLVGESGSGKTTVGRAILRLIEPEAGEVMFKGENILEKSPAEMVKLRRDLQIIFQDPYSSLNPRMSVEKLIAENLKIHRYGSKAAIRERVEYLVEKVGLSKEVLGSYPHELDGGRCQRVGIARAIALSPSFIVCDEPVSALDVSVQAQVLNLLEELSSELNLTYLFISHDLSVVRRISHRIVVLYLGMVMETASSKELFDDPQHPYTQALLSAVPTLNIDKRRERIILKGDVPTPINLGEGCRFYTRCIHAMERCKCETPKLVERSPRHYVACHLYGGGTESAGEAP